MQISCSDVIQTPVSARAGFCSATSSACAIQRESCIKVLFNHVRKDIHHDDVLGRSPLPKHQGWCWPLMALQVFWDSVHVEVFLMESWISAQRRTHLWCNAGGVAAGMGAAYSYCGGNIFHQTPQDSLAAPLSCCHDYWDCGRGDREACR
jgi:hypothetical protein